MTGMVLPLALAAGAWWLLASGDPASWVIGVPAVLAAAFAIRRTGTNPVTGIAPGALAGFLAFFLRESLRGGIDVAARTLVPRMRIRPGFSEYHTRLARHDARVFFTNCVSLLPGTLAADLEGDRLRVHMLDTGSDPEPELRRLEQRVARLYRGEHHARS